MTSPAPTPVARTRGRSPLLLAGAAGAAAGLAGALLAGTASAEPVAVAPATLEPATGVVVTADPAGDIDAGVDLLRSRLVNGDMVRVALHHDDLVRHPAHGVGASIFLDTDPDRKGPEFQFLAGLFEGTDYVLVESTDWKPGKTVPMKTCFYELRLDYTDDRSVVRMEPGCLGDPEQLRISVRATADTAEGTQRDWLPSRRHFTEWAASTR